ncbi:MAG: helix-turn-helix domain-containing protein [Candidatus Omnitrophica bacterium]|nr:helix-turn-helix domain-containing protein [Candidatus Omnitrophota bacterium]
MVPIIILGLHVIIPTWIAMSQDACLIMTRSACFQASVRSGQMVNVKDFDPRMDQNNQTEINIMNQQQLEFRATQGGNSQCDRILARLRRSVGGWIPMPELWKASGAFAIHSRICDLRTRGFEIEHKNERQPDGRIQSFYRLMKTENLQRSNE